MTRFRNKIGKTWKPRPGKYYSARYMRILKNLDDAEVLWIIQPKQDTEFYHQRFGDHCTVYNNHNDDELIFHDSLIMDLKGDITDHELEFMMQIGEGEGAFIRALTGEIGYGEM